MPQLEFTFAGQHVEGLDTNKVKALFSLFGFWGNALACGCRFERSGAFVVHSGCPFHRDLDGDTIGLIPNGE